MSIWPALVDEGLFWKDGGEGQLRLRYLGTAGFCFEGDGQTVVIDPYVTRPSLLRTGLCRLRPDEERISAIIPRADQVLVGHSHYDHVLDAPTLCRLTGATLVGSPDTAHVARAAGLDEAQMVATRGGETLSMGKAEIRGVASAHGRVYFGRVPLPGTIDAPPRWPPRFFELPHGLVLNWHVTLAGVRVVHVDSAEYVRSEVEGLQADVVCLCAIGRRYRPRYVEEIVELLRPKHIVACHWDWFFSDYHAPMRCLPAVDLTGFVDEIRQAGVEPVVLPNDGVFTC